MRVNPAIAALRGSPGSQRRSASATARVGTQEGADALKRARQEWLAAPLTQMLARDLARYGAQEPLSSCLALNDFIADHETARALTDSLLKGMLDALRTHPFGEAPFRFKVSRGLATVQLIQAGEATLSLSAYEPLDRAAAPTTALFSDREVHEIVISGAASGVVHSCADEGALTSQFQTWQQGDTIGLRAQEQARQILNVERAFVLLQLTREPARPAPTRLVALDTGKTQRTASGDKSASQAAMALGVLGALGEHGALDVMEQTALNRDEDTEVRWEAARQTLGLDPARGLDVLSTLTRRKGDPLAQPAQALRAQLLDAQPELRALVP